MKKQLALMLFQLPLDLSLALLTPSHYKQRLNCPTRTVASRGYCIEQGLQQKDTGSWELFFYSPSILVSLWFVLIDSEALHQLQFRLSIFSLSLFCAFQDLVIKERSITDTNSSPPRISHKPVHSTHRHTYIPTYLTTLFVLIQPVW